MLACGLYSHTLVFTLSIAAQFDYDFVSTNLWYRRFFQTPEVFAKQMFLNKKTFFPVLTLGKTSKINT